MPHIYLVRRIERAVWLQSLAMRQCAQYALAVLCVGAFHATMVNQKAAMAAGFSDHRARYLK